MKKTTRQVQGYLDTKEKTKKYVSEKELFEAYPNKYGIEESLFKQILETFSLFVVKELFEGTIINLPSRMGTLGVRTYKRKLRTRHFDFVLYNATGEKKVSHPVWDTPIITKLVWEVKYPHAHMKIPYLFKLKTASTFVHNLKNKIKNENSIHIFYPID